MALTSWTQQQVLAQLDSGYHWSSDTITYAFPTATSGIYGSTELTGFVALNSTQQSYATLALQTWDDLISPDFEKTTSLGSDIEFGTSSTGVSYAHAYFPTTSSVWFSRAYSELLNPQVGQHSFLTYVHEIGHALGLDHMGDYNGTGTWTPSSYQDSGVYSVMSYFGPNWGSGSSNGEGLVAWADWVGSDGQTYSPQTPMLNDIMAIQSIYGAETTTRTGDTVYGFNCTITDSLKAIYDFTLNAHPILTIYDSLGTDTLNLSGWNTNSVINLAPGAFSSCNSMTDNIAIAYSCNIENAVGGGGNDTLLGNGLDNQLDGGSGNDTLEGGDGNDTLVAGLGNDQINGGDGTDTALFAATWASYTYSYTASTGLTLYNATTGADLLLNVEVLQFLDTLKLVSELIGGTSSGSTTVSIGASNSSVVEGNTGSTVVSFVVSLGAAANTTESVSWSVSGATDSSDFVGDTSGSLTFLAGETQKTIQLQIAGDISVETDESFSVTLSNASSGLVLGTAAATTIITNDDQTIYGADDYPLSTDTTGVLTVNGDALTGTIETGTDGDFFKVNLVAGTTYEFNLKAITGSLDPYLELYGSALQWLTYNDDANGTTNSKIVYTATATGTYYLAAWDYSSQFTGSYTISATTAVGSTLYGNANANTLTGGVGDDTLYGLGGNDTLTGNGNNDYLDGGTGTDKMTGGNGNDTYIVDTAGDTAIESSTAGGVDQVISTVSFTLGNYVENLTLSGSNAINATGNSLANNLVGNSGNNILDGKTGTDSFWGGTGNDTYVLDQEAELLQVNEYAAAGTDTLKITYANTTTAAKNVSLAGNLSNIEHMLVSGTGLFNLAGNDLNNALTGNASINSISGELGNDTLYGLGGNDSLFGNDGADRLIGGAGNDTLTGGADADVFRFDTTLSTSSNVDTLVDFLSGVDKIELENSFFTKLTNIGGLSAQNFVASATGTAVDSNDYIIYNTSTGALYYDADGAGTGTAVMFAKLTGLAFLQESDFVIT